MPLVTVYQYRIYDGKNHLYDLPDGMCTENTISQIKNSIIIRESAKQVDDSELTQSGRYYDPSQEKKEVCKL